MVDHDVSISLQAYAWCGGDFNCGTALLEDNIHNAAVLFLTLTPRLVTVVVVALTEPGGGRQDYGSAACLRLLLQRLALGRHCLGTQGCLQWVSGCSSGGHTFDSLMMVCTFGNLHLLLRDPGGGCETMADSKPCVVEWLRS